jgi:serine/threonine protein phosphatase PrpC
MAFEWRMLPGLGWLGGRKPRPTPRPARPEGRPTLGAEGRSIEGRIVAASLTDVGCVRDGNEDSFRIVRPLDDRKDPLLAMVCDGMGGHAAGETASRLATDVIAASYRGDGDPGEALAEAVRAANRAIHEAARSAESLRGMGTTCTAVAIRDGKAWCAHVGDSRCYLIRDNDILLMTEDHSSVMAMVREGTITAQEARHHPDKNVILRALGSHAEVAVFEWPQPFVLHPGDRLVLCSDGLYDLIEDDEILGLVDGTAPQTACSSLVALARQRGAPDNVTVVILAVPEPQSASVHVTRPVPVMR